MKCANCKIEMKKGSLVLNGTGWTDGKTISPDNIITKALGMKKIETVLAFKCQKCGKIELVAEI